MHLHPRSCAGPACRLCELVVTRADYRRKWGVSDELAERWAKETPWVQEWIANGMPHGPTVGGAKQREGYRLEPCVGCKGNVRRKVPTAAPETIIGEGPLCVVTLNIGHVMSVNSRASIMAAAKRWGAAFVELGMPLKQIGGKIAWQKAFLRDWAENKGYERVAYYDSDVVIRSDCPNIFEQVPCGHLGICSNQQTDFSELSGRRHRRYDSDRRWWQAKLGGNLPPAERHVNGGLVVFEPQAHRELFERWKQAGESVNWGRADVLIDEAAISVILENSDVPRTWLPSTFDCLFYRSPALVGSRDMKAFAYHAAGRNKERLNFLRWDLSEDGDPFTWESIKEEGMFDYQDVYAAQVERVQGPAVFVELGSWRGKSAAYMATLIKASGKPIKFYAVDTFKGTQKTPKHGWMRSEVARNGGTMLNVWRENLRKCGVLEFATPIESDSANAANAFEDGSVDFVWVDADHSFDAVMRDIKAWTPKVKPGGVLAGHDWNLPDVSRAVRQEIGEVKVSGRAWVRA